jgi:hypothetical protein
MTPTTIVEMPPRSEMNVILRKLVRIPNSTRAASTRRWYSGRVPVKMNAAPIKTNTTEILITRHAETPEVACA